VATVEFRLPDVGEGIDAADLLEWHVAEGGEVREHEALVEVQTDKAVTEIPSPATGTLVRQGAPAGESVRVGEVLAVIETRAAAPADPPPTAPSSAPAEPPPAAGPSAPAEPPLAAAPSASAAAVTSRPLAAPATRKLARDKSVDLHAITGTGPHGRITKDDVEQATTRSPATGETVPLRGTRRAIARAMTEAWRTVPLITDYREVDASALLALRPAIMPTPLLVKIAATAIASHPYVNASVDLEREEITLHPRADIGVATASEAGLVVPVVKDAAARSVEEIAAEVKRLTEAARANRLRAEDLEGGTFTVNNYGPLGVWLGTPIVNPPQVCNLGIGAIRDQVIPVDGRPAVRPVAALAVAADHRVLDGHTLAAFVTDVVRLIEQPALLLGRLR
jgi:pyruvate dehydrogenase E2 component (dihydrolipoamide acetyltransferase)